jgi:tripartite-type tricarboxylate transporter receptor subunit TctC
MSAVLFKNMTSLDVVIVPYRGNYMPDLLSGQVQVAFNPTALDIEFVKDSRLRAIAVTTAKPSSILPGVSTIGEFVPGFEASGWYGVYAPRQTPEEIVKTLHDTVNSCLSDPKLNGRLTDLGIQVTPLTIGAFQTFVDDEIKKWGTLIKTAGIKPE